MRILLTILLLSTNSALAQGVSDDNYVREAIREKVYIPEVSLKVQLNMLKDMKSKGLGDPKRVDDGIAYLEEKINQEK